MSSMKAYIFSVTAAALLCTICMRLLSGQSTAAALGKMLTGLFLLFCLISPLRDIRVGNVLALTDDWKTKADQAKLQGETASKNALCSSIITQTKAYILNKAASLHAEISVEVMLSEEAIPIPVQVSIKGEVAPYAKALLQRMIETDLGIPKEKQIWQ